MNVFASQKVGPAITLCIGEISADWWPGEVPHASQNEWRKICVGLLVVATRFQKWSSLCGGKCEYFIL